jgi:F-type H+-transporting ATPase subunit delta
MTVAAKRYARALIDVLYPDKAEDGFYQLQSLASLFTDQPDGRKFLQNPSMAGERRNRLLKEIADALGFDRRVANFVNILTERNRLPLLEEIIGEYQHLMDDKLGIARAQVTSARALDPAQQRELVSKLEQITGKQIRMDVAIDPSLIGGVIARVGSTVFDVSVRQQLQEFKSRLVAE